MAQSQDLKAELKGALTEIQKNRAAALSAVTKAKNTTLQEICKEHSSTLKSLQADIDKRVAAALGAIESARQTALDDLRDEVDIEMARVVAIATAAGIFERGRQIAGAEKVVERAVKVTESSVLKIKTLTKSMLPDGPDVSAVQAAAEVVNQQWLLSQTLLETVKTQVAEAQAAIQITTDAEKSIQRARTTRTIDKHTETIRAAEGVVETLCATIRTTIEQAEAAAQKATQAKVAVQTTLQPKRPHQPGFQMHQNEAEQDGADQPKPTRNGVNQHGGNQTKLTQNGNHQTQPTQNGNHQIKFTQDGDNQDVDNWSVVWELFAGKAGKVAENHQPRSRSGLSPPA
ncbi:MAG: hypothetical protein AAF152_16020 [Cyanobacteria bacterium P01_A01_bin.114]